MQTISRKAFVAFYTHEGEGKAEVWEDGVIKPYSQNHYSVSSTRPWDQGCTKLQAIEDEEADTMETSDTDSDLEVTDISGAEL